MSERIELTRGEPNLRAPLEYSGPSPRKAVDVLRLGNYWWGPIKVWCDDTELLAEFLALVSAEHPGGAEAVSAIHRERYAMAHPAA